MASQMAPAVFDTTTVDFDIAGDERQPDIEPRAAICSARPASIVKFQGFLALYREAHEEGDSKALEDEQALPVVDVGEKVPCKGITPRQHFTEPPPRFSRSEPRQGARAARHRSTVYVCVDHLGARRPPLRRARAASLLPDASSARPSRR